MKKLEIVNAVSTTAQLRQKVLVAAVALTLFYCRDISNEILTKVTSESKRREMSFDSYGEKLHTSHTLLQKQCFANVIKTIEKGNIHVPLERDDDHLAGPWPSQMKRTSRHCSEKL